jgi:hypothetical protein
MAKSSVSIPKAIRDEVGQIVEKYNQEHREQYKVSFRGRFCYLSRIDDHSAEANLLAKVAKLMGIKTEPNPAASAMATQIGRLEWNGSMDTWEFAVYKYSREAYDPDEWFFPGQKCLDGTIQGALQAGRIIYP